MDFESLARAQEADCTRLKAEVDKIQARIDGLDQNLRSEVLAQRAAAIRAEAGESMKNGEISRIRADIQSRSEAVKLQARFFTPEGERRAARFHEDPALNATIQLATFTRLAKTPTAELIAHLEDAVDAGNLALAEAVRLEFGNRPDAEGVKESYRAAWSKVKTPKADHATALISKIVGLQSMADEHTVALVRGRSNPMARLTAARQMNAA